MMIEKDIFIESGYPKKYFEVEALDEGISYIPPTAIPTPTVNLPFEEEIELPVDNIPVSSPTIPPTPKVLPEDFIKLIREEDLIIGGGYISNQPVRTAPRVPPLGEIDEPVSGISPQMKSKIEADEKRKKTIIYVGVGLVAIFIGILIFKK